MRPDQLGDFRVPTDAYMHPDGKRAVFVVTQMDLEDDEYISQIWMFDGEGVRQITSGKADSSPRWSPDGATLAFLRKGPGDDDRPQVALMPTDGGEAEVITDLDLGASSIEWSPDGTKIAVAIAEYIDGVEEEDERKRLAKRIEHPSFRFDNIGWTHDKRSHIWILDVETHDTTQLTEGDHSDAGFVWNPDGETILYLSSTGKERWTNPLNQVFTIDASGGEPTPVTPKGEWAWAGFDPQGSLLVLGGETDELTLRPPQIHRVGDDGSLIQLTDIDRNMMPGHPGGPLTAPRFLHDGAMTAVLEDEGTQRVISIAPDGAISDIVGGHRSIAGWDPNTDGSAAVFTASSPTNPGEVYWWDGANERAITALNEGFAASVELVEPEPFMFESDGHEIHGWVYLPPGDEKVPLLYNIHGGPAAQYDSGFFDEFQVYVGAGYGVVAINPRGSTGYGYDHVSMICGRWDEEMPPDMLDLTTAPYEAAKRFDRLDLDRLGVMGGSYGGVATAMVTALDQSYRSAVAERGVYNWLSMAGTSDIPFFMDLYLGTNMPEGADMLWKASPLARSHAITTPTLVIHSETDFRCPIEQGQQFFTTLYRSGVETELLIFPSGEGHELSRSGKPKHRVERFEAILDWHERHIG
ncbi:MAG: S9 family peptidase [Actinomycetota bacterium]